MKVLLLNDTTNWYHFGCTATSIALKDGIRECGHILTSISITETYKIVDAPSTKAGFLRRSNLLDFIGHNKDLICLIMNNDAVVINGGGTIHGINPAPLSLLFVAYIAKKEFGKRVEIINHSPYPEHDDFIRDSEESAIYKLVYSTIDFVAITEPKSYSTMMRLDIEAIESFDCSALYIRNYYIRSNIKRDKEILITGSAIWLDINMVSSDKCNIEDFADGLLEFDKYLQHMISRGFKIRFLCGAESHPSKDDKEFIEYMQENFSANLEVYEAPSVTSWLRAIEEAALIVSGRFHHTIAAACLGTEFIGFSSNTPKIDGLMEALESKEAIKFNSPDVFDKLLSTTEEKLRINSKNDMRNKGTDYLNLLSAKAEMNFIGLRTANALDIS